MASLIYNSCLRDTFRGRFDFENDAFRVLLLGAGYRPDKENHSRRSDLSDEVASQGYEAGGAAVDVRAAMIDDALTLTLGGHIWDNATITARYAVYCKDRGGDPEQDEIVGVIDFGSDVTSGNSTWTLTASTLRIRN